MSYDYDTDVSTMEFLGQAHRSLWLYVLSNIFNFTLGILRHDRTMKVHYVESHDLLVT